jgi:transposase
MPRPLSIDLRERLVRAVEEGGTVRAVGARFGVSPSSVSKISRRWRETGSVAPKPMGGDRRPHATEAHGQRILALIEEAPDLRLAEIQGALARDGVEVGLTSIWRFFRRHQISFKKNRARQRAGPAGRGRGPARLAGAPAAA